MGSTERMSRTIKSFWTGPRGPKSTHFWGTLANLGFVAAGLVDAQKPPDHLSPNVTTALCAYSALYLRVAWVAQPRAYLMLAVHAANEAVQLHNLRRWYSHRWGYSVSGKDDTIPSENRTRVLVLGSGWGGMSFLSHLHPSLAQGIGQYDVTLVSPRNYFLFTPLLPGAAMGSVELRSIVDPVRRHITGEGAYYEAECIKINAADKTVTCRYPKTLRGPEQRERTFTLPYDLLVLAVGSINNHFGVPGVKEHCYFLKDVEDAKALRQRVNECFEVASLPVTTPEERKRLLTFVVVGGGPTGVEVAAELHDLIVEDMTDLFPYLRDQVSVRLINTSDHILSMYDRQIAVYATQQFNRQGIDLVLNSRVKAVEDSAVVVTKKGSKEECKVEFGTCVWSTGIRMHPLVEDLVHQLPEDQQGNWKSLRTDTFLRVKGGGGGIFALGDAATVEQESALAHAAELFRQGDTNQDGVLSCLEIQALMKTAKDTYPQLAEYAMRLNCNGKKEPGAVDRLYSSLLGHKEEAPSAVEALLARDAEALQRGLTLEQFQQELAEVDRSLRSLPATAQVAHQQGRFLAHLFRDHRDLLAAERSAHDLASDNPRPFRYENMGQLAYTGADTAVMESAYKGTPLGSFKGWLMGFAWKGAEIFMQNSPRNMYMVARDLALTRVFGRDVSDC